MTNFARAFAFACLLRPGVAMAQEIASFAAVPAEVSHGQLAEFAIDFRTAQSHNSSSTAPADWRCGLVVNFGDGKNEFHRIDVKQVPYKVTHKYDTPGNYAVTIEGKTQLQGLRLTLPCLGDNRSVALVVRPDDFAAREAAERSAREDALKRATADREAAERAADRAKRDRAAAERAAQKAASERAGTAKSPATDRSATETRASPKPQDKPAAAETKPSPAPAKARSAMDN